MKLIVGLGNPGKKYKKTRHNIGFMFLDSFADTNNLKFNLDINFKCEMLDTMINGEKVILIKPQTFMNLSGESVKLVKDYFDIDISDILIIHDDLDLPVGTIRFRSHGTSGGHNGLQNIFDKLETNEIKRLKVGIDKPKYDNTIDYVLGNFEKNEINIISEYIDQANIIIRDFCELNFENLMSRYNN